MVGQTRLNLPLRVLFIPGSHPFLSDVCFFVVFLSRNITKYKNLIGSLLEAYEAMYHYYLIWEAR